MLLIRKLDDVVGLYWLPAAAEPRNLLPLMGDLYSYYFLLLNWNKCMIGRKHMSLCHSLESLPYLLILSLVIIAV